MVMPETSLKIRLYGDPCLRKKSIPLKVLTDQKLKLIQSMITMMQENKGIGLAAPQLGINERLIVVDVGEGPIVLVNPQIKSTEGSAELEEGCLSIPGVMVNVTRPQRITVQYCDENNKRIEKECENLLARVILHEIDHLNGKLIVDYAGITKRKEIKEQLREIENQNKKF